MLLYIIFITTTSSEPSCGLKTLTTCYNRASGWVRHAHKQNRRTNPTLYVLCTLAHSLTGTTKLSARELLTDYPSLYLTQGALRRQALLCEVNGG
jgi:hypothetical protein